MFDLLYIYGLERTIYNIFDSNGCQKTGMAIISQPEQLNAEMFSSQVSCNGAADGSALVTASGTNPLSYQWSNGETLALATSLIAGTNYISVTDGNCARRPHQRPTAFIIFVSLNRTELLTEKEQNNVHGHASLP